ncbi:hypothetical protein CEXT_491041 [Caerostris extrusa]|uniref:Uncharacterized protein n=1 Tax=Caerostris extrusa TaxID=172846 RepID=A0AAV4RXH8_CAEEX|nr:hypothetical protein CEXT_491041 [Caerostris extrusa]
MWVINEGGPRLSTRAWAKITFGLEKWCRGGKQPSVVWEETKRPGYWNEKQNHRHHRPHTSRKTPHV